MPSIRNMRVEDVETVARMDALDHDSDLEMGYEEARQHTLDHLEIVLQHCYVVEDGNVDAIARWFCIHGKTFLRSKTFT